MMSVELVLISNWWV